MTTREQLLELIQADIEQIVYDAMVVEHIPDGLRELRAAVAEDWLEELWGGDEDLFRVDFLQAMRAAFEWSRKRGWL
jgi:hypothetical protein